MAKLSAAKRKKIPKKDFAIKSRAKTPEDKAEHGNYPIDTRARALSALRLVGMHGTEAEKRQVRAAVKHKYPDIKQS